MSAREARLRRQAKRLGLTLEKSRSRNPLSHDHGTYRLVDYGGVRLVGDGTSSAAIVYGQVEEGWVVEEGMDLDQVEEWLNRPAEEEDD